MSKKAAFERHAQDTNQMTPQDLSQSSSLRCEGSQSSVISALLGTTERKDLFCKRLNFGFQD